MKHIFKYLLIVALIGIFFILSLPVTASESKENTNLKSMITELEKKVDAADKSMIAHPFFIKQLRKLVKKYKSKLRETFFKETFNDGNFDKNPRWIVKSGEFKVSSAGRLTSFLPMRVYETKIEDTPKQLGTPEEEAIGRIIGSIFGSDKKEQKQIQKQKKQQVVFKPAYIFTKKTFSPDFEMNLKFKLSKKGEMGIVLLGSQNFSPRYFLKIKANSSKSDPIEIVRRNNSRNFIVGASNKFPVINDGKFHTLTWVRLTDGAMNVLIDGDIILHTYEFYHKDNFTGFGITNKGGTYMWDSFEIFKALKPKAG